MAQLQATGAAVQDYVEFVRSRPDLNELEARLVELVRAYGFDHHAYAVIRTPKTREVADFLVQYEEGATARRISPPEWIDRYDYQDYYLIDPILKAAWSNYFPFRWDHLERSEEFSRQHKDLFRDARDAGLNSGMTIPLHGPAEGLSVLSLASKMSWQEFDACWDECRVDLFTAAAFTHEAIVAAATRPSALSDVHLSSRELECLKWTSEGKTTWEISQILGLSQDTTRFYLREATRKFGVHSKHHAVVKAIAAGLISP